MDSFEQAGLARLMAAGHNARLARGLAVIVKGWFTAFRAWLDAMPTTLPPTDSFRR